VGSHSDLFRIAASTGSYEPKLAEVCASQLSVDRDAIDIGANVGFYTVLFAQLLPNRRVLSIEPAERALARLQVNLELNGVRDRVVVFSGVASSRKGEARLHTVVGREEYSSLGSMTHPRICGSACAVVPVACETIDNLVHEHGLDPGFVKLDVEGMEHAVLDGMRDVLQNKRPTILLELLDPLLRRNGSSSRQVIDFLRSYGYDVSDPTDLTSDVGNWTCGELLCVPTP
jgi:FkbM family methyltransferase